MADTIKPTTPPPLAKAEEPVGLLQKLFALETEAMKQVGNPNFNPLLWIRKNILPLREEISKGPISEECLDKINNLKVPIVKK